MTGRKPIVGAPRGQGSCPKTVSLITKKLSDMSGLTGKRLLDVGCGDGTFTRVLADGFAEVYGIDVQDDWLERFREKVSGNPKIVVQRMSASEMTFPPNFFDTLVSIETLEHIPDLEGAVKEFSRVLRPGGECLITCPNRLFPFENHGIRWKNAEINGRIPLITYIPALHDRFALARVFTVRSLDRLFLSNGFVRRALDYAWPTFEHGANRFQPALRPLFGFMRVLERSRFRMFGTSIVVKYEKHLESPASATMPII